MPPQTEQALKKFIKRNQREKPTTTKDNKEGKPISRVFIYARYNKQYYSEY